VALIVALIRSVVALAEVDGAIDELAVAEGASFLRPRRHHHGLVAGRAPIQADPCQHYLIVYQCSLAVTGLALSNDDVTLRIDLWTGRATPTVGLSELAVDAAQITARQVLLLAPSPSLEHFFVQDLLVFL